MAKNLEERLRELDAKYREATAYRDHYVAEVTRLEGAMRFVHELIQEEQGEVMAQQEAEAEEARLQAEEAERRAQEDAIQVIEEDAAPAVEAATPLIMERKLPKEVVAAR